MVILMLYSVPKCPQASDAARVFEKALSLNGEDYRVRSNAALAYAYARSNAKALSRQAQQCE